MITIIKDKEPIWEVEEYDVVLLGTSIYCTMGGGFASKVKYKYPIVEEEDDKTGYGDRRKLGKRLTIGDKPVISLMYISHYPNRNRCTLDYEALKNCLITANNEFKGKKVVSTIIGSSRFDGNGDKDKCLKLIEEYTKDLNLYIYDYTQISRREEIKKIVKHIFSFKKTDKQKFLELLSLKESLLKKLYLA